jgi:hypothetical protein
LLACFGDFWNRRSASVVYVFVCGGGVGGVADVANGAERDVLVVGGSEGGVVDRLAYGRLLCD